MNVGGQVIIQANFKGRDGQPKDPTVVIGKVIEEDGNQVTLSFINTNVGTWEATFNITKPGKHYIGVQGIGNLTAEQEKHFTVKVPKVTFV